MRFTSVFINGDIEEFDAENWNDALEQALGHEEAPNELINLRCWFWHDALEEKTK